MCRVHTRLVSHFLGLLAALFVLLTPIDALIFLLGGEEVGRVDVNVCCIFHTGPGS
jgi:hypothetical protein